MDAVYRGYIPKDAVIPAPDGIYLVDEDKEKRFEKPTRKK